MSKTGSWSGWNGLGAWLTCMALVAACDYVEIDPVGFQLNDDGDPIDGDAVCGNGILEGDELCDEGENNGQGDCRSDCTFKASGYCGDGIVQADLGEDCDDGVNDGSLGGCLPGCIPTPTVCGDGYLGGDEACDDGNVLDGDGCNATCELECGFVCEQPGTPCELDCNTLNDLVAAGECADSPAIPQCCGDGVLQEALGEQCDDGNDIDNDQCSNECIIIVV